MASYLCFSTICTFPNGHIKHGGIGCDDLPVGLDEVLQDITGVLGCLVVDKCIQHRPVQIHRRWHVDHVYESLYDGEC